MAAGIRFGKKPHKEASASEALIRQGETFSAVAAKAGISRATYYRLKSW